VKTESTAGGARADEAGTVNARIVYWGAEGAGKRTNLRVIHAKLRPDHRGELRFLPTRLDPSVTYPVLPIELGEVGGVRTRIQIVAVPGDADQAPTRKQLLDRTDGVVFVVDARREHLDANLASFEELRSALAAYGRPLEQMPLVIQYNKRDLADPYAMEELHRKLSMRGVAAFEAVAKDGTAVLQTLTTISKRVIRHLRERAQDEDATAAAPAKGAPAPRGAAPASPPARPAPPPGTTQLIDRAELAAALAKPAAARETPPPGTTQLIERVVSAEDSRPDFEAATAIEVPARPDDPGFGETVDSAASLFESSFEAAKRSPAGAQSATKRPLATAARAMVDVEPQADADGLAIELAGPPQAAPGGLRIALFVRGANGRRQRLVLTLRLEGEDA
jgi:hypothetical protein